MGLARLRQVSAEHHHHNKRRQAETPRGSYCVAAAMISCRAGLLTSRQQQHLGQESWPGTQFAQELQT